MATVRERERETEGEGERHYSNKTRAVVPEVIANGNNN